MIKKLAFLILAFFTFLAVAQPSLAAVERGIELRDIEGSDCTFDSEFGEIVTLDCVPILVFNLVYWLLVFVGVVALFLIIFGGFKFMTSGGDPNAVEGARKTITWAIVGLIVVVSSFAIVAFIGTVTGVGCITRFGFENCGRSGELYRCSADHPTGWCDNDKQNCVRLDRGIYDCRYPCGTKKDDGTIGKWCSNGTCTEIRIPVGSTNATYWSCR